MNIHCAYEKNNKKNGGWGLKSLVLCFYVQNENNDNIFH